MKIGDRKDVQEFLRGQITKALDQCSEKERAMFALIFGGDARDVRVRYLLDALELCERTLAKNEKTGRLITM